MKTNLEDDEDSDEEDDDFDYDETALESFVTPLDDDDTSPDEYQIFRTVYDGVQAENPPWFQKLASGLNDDNFKSIQEVFKLGEQRLAAKRSKSIEKAGGTKIFAKKLLKSWINFNFTFPGYQFPVVSVPGQFNFAPSTDNFRFGGSGGN